MSYHSRAQDPRRRTVAITGVVAVHALLALGLLKGLEVDFQRIVDPRIRATDIPLDPPPPPPEPQRQEQPPDSFVTAPPTPIEPLVTQPVDLVVQRPLDEPRQLVVDPGPTVEPVVEPTRPAFAPRKARPSNNPARWITTDDYPARALRAEAEGIAAYRLIVGSSGQVSACEVTRSTGNGQLDEATCDFIVRRARFEPASDETGAKVVGSYTGTVRWEIPE